MTKKTRLMIKKYSLIVLGAAIIAVGAFYVVNNPTFFTASVLSLQEKTFITEKERDIAYKTDSGAVDIFIGENLEVPASINFTIMFDTNTVIIDTQKISGQGTRTVSNPDENSVIIQATPSQTIDKTQSFLILPFTGESKNILLGEAIIQPSNGKERSLSIGSLNNITSHSTR